MRVGQGVLTIVALFCALVPEGVSAQAPVDRPQRLDEESIACMRSKMNELAKSAGQAFPSVLNRYRAGLGEGRRLFVTTVLFDEQRRQEQVFVEVFGLRGDTILGELNSDIGFISGFRRGDRLMVLPDALVDWTISHPDGTEEGNALGKYMDDLQAKMRADPDASICALIGGAP